MDKLLIEFTCPDNLSRVDQTFRIVRTYSERLVLERRYTNSPEDGRWVVVSDKEVRNIFEEDARWKRAWKSAGISLDDRRGMILDTRDVVDIPIEYQGVIHGYKISNRHAPDSMIYDIYAVRQVHGMTFTGLVDVLLPVTDAEVACILIGALYLLACEEN